ncbi:MAG: catechol 2,3-dioxygenase [Thermoleophilaceae bacterium]|jgi:catechol 2,3-dioxygenase|nr:catechol 2,3-dioxygenase [Thermoleophilaceae bacterium]
MELGPLHLTVTDLDRSVGFYQDAIGLKQHSREDPVATLGTGDGMDLLVLHEEPGARPAGRHAGLYHFALLFPTREELARALQRLAVTRTPIQGASDHGVSEAIYLNDPDGNGIELYGDRPREEWPPPRSPNERVGMFTEPLDIPDLLALVEGAEPVRHAGDGLRLGHMHLHVGDVEDALRFYQDELGLEEMARYPGAAFVAWDGYHHHLGFNTWRGEGVPPAPDDAVGVRHWTVYTGGDEAGEERMLRDPSGNRVLLTRG